MSFSFLDDEYITSKPEGLVLINLTKNKSDILLTQDDKVSVISFTKSSDYDMVNNKALLCCFFVFTVSIEPETLCHHVVSVMSVTCL